LVEASDTCVHEGCTSYVVSEAEDAAIYGDVAAQRVGPVSATLPLVPVNVIDPVLRDDPICLAQTETITARHFQNTYSARHSKLLPTIVDATRPSSFKGEDTGYVSLQRDAYPVDCLLGKWGGSYFVKWAQDGCYSWEPRGNILDDELVATFERNYTGFGRGVEVLRTRIRKGKTEYLLRCMAARNKKTGGCQKGT
jgi:hypothetical protein